MLPSSPCDTTQTNFFDITSQLERTHSLLTLGKAIDWPSLEKSFAPLYSTKGRGAKPIRLMSGLLMLNNFISLAMNP